MIQLHLPIKSSIFVQYCTFGGICASIGSMFGKLSSSFEDNLLLTALTFVLMLTFNTTGMLYFTKGLQASPSSVIATIITSASNYVSTAIIGIVLFGEKTPFAWWLGTTFIIIGIVLIGYHQGKEKR